MQWSEARKFLIALLTSAVTVLTAVAATFGSVIPDDAGLWIAAIVAVCTAGLVWLVPNRRSVPEKLEATVDALAPTEELVKDLVRRELESRRIREQNEVTVKAEDATHEAPHEAPHEVQPVESVVDHRPAPQWAPPATEAEFVEVVETAQQRLDEVQTEMQKTFHKARQDFAEYIGRHRED